MRRASQAVEIAISRQLKPRLEGLAAAKPACADSMQSERWRNGPGQESGDWVCLTKNGKGHREAMQEEHVEYYKDGSVKGKGLLVDGTMEGYWEWFRKNGTKMRSGHFKAGEQVGEWITYDQQGQVYKVTDMDKKAQKAAVKPAVRSGSVRQDGGQRV